uniref:Uncharacterized protein n=1 Tax=Nicotiana tabacum TaxID=4097 RepID=A0A1S4AGQ6_TOBAC|nr:PREDICTED: uncharacterized protein LOC107797447 [Nicotiana tabacum]
MAAENISALQLKKGVKRHEPTFLATICIEDIELSSGHILAPVKELLLEFEDPNTGRTPGALAEGPSPIAGAQIICEAIQVILCSKQIDFLEHFVEEGQIKMDQQKIQAITDWSPPKDIHALRAFLRLCNFYR